MYLRMLALLVAAIVLIAALADGTALAASNRVGAGSIAVHTELITANHLKPWQCASMNVGSVVTGSGQIRGTGAAELLLGSSGNDNIDARGGGDCVVGGAGADRLDGGGGTDVCVGTWQPDSYRRCEVEYP